MSVPPPFPEAHPPSSSSLPEAPDVAVLTFDARGRVRTPPHPPEAFLMHPPDDCVGRSIEDVLPTSIGRQLLERVRHAADQGTPVAIDLYHPRAHRWIEAQIQPESSAVTVTFRDRTHRKQCETLLHLLDSSVLEGLWRASIDGTITVANAAFARFLGYQDAAAVEGKNAARLLAETESRPTWKVLRTAALERGVVEAVSCSYRRRDGTLVQGQTRLNVVRDQHGDVRTLDGSVIEEGTASGAAPRQGLLERAAEAIEEAIMVTEAEPIESPGPRIVAVNSAFTDLTGYAADTAVGRTPRLLYGPATDTDVLRSLQAHLQAEQPFRGEAVLYRRDNTPYVSQWSVAPVRDESGAVAHWVVVQRDVTDRRNAETALRTHERRAEILYTSLGPLLESTTPEQAATEAARLAVEGLGFAQAVVRQHDGEMLAVLAMAGNATAASVTLDGDHPAVRAFQSNDLVVDDAHLHRPLGTHGVLSVENAYSVDASLLRLLDTLAAHAAKVLDRITQAAYQRKAHERSEALREAGRALLAAGSVPTGTETAFEALVPLLPSTARLRLFSFGPDDEMARVRAANDRPLADLERGTAWPVDAGLDRFRHSDALHAVDDLGPEPTTALEERLVRAGCRSYVAAPVVEEERVQGMLLLAAETPEAFTRAHCTVAKETADLLASALTRMRPEEDRASETAADEPTSLQSALLANVHHELRTPLTSIIGFAEVLSSEEDDATGRFADLIARSGQRLQETFDDLLTLSRLEANTMTVDPSPLSVTTEVHTVLESFEERAHEAQISFEWEGLDTSVDAMLDHNGLHDVLHHLLDNAITFTEAGGTVTVRLDALDEAIALSVADTGIGMDPGRVPDLFAPFQQASTGLNRAYEGCGLGLAIVQGWTEAMGGSVDVTTAPEEGTTVTVRLPR